MEGQPDSGPLADEEEPGPVQPHPELSVVRAQPFNAEAPREALASAVTPTRFFYVRSHFDVPRLKPAAHRLRVDGAVGAPLELSMAELWALPRQSVTATLECAGNHRTTLAPLPPGEPWQAGAVSTARWTGVPLRAVLARAGLRPGVVELLAEGADGGAVEGKQGHIAFARSLPLEVALREDTLLALEMNGRPLPPHHGAPVRLVVPGWYGVASVKWVVRLVALEQPFRGHFQTEKYIYDFGDGRPPAPVTWAKVKALLSMPTDGDVLPQRPWWVRGRAWAGEATVAKVEVAVGGGDRWREARLLGTPSPWAWREFELPWEALAPGRHVLRCRATDARGQCQPDTPRWNRLGYGANAIQAITLSVR